jgi:hypothetical protein
MLLPRRPRRHHVRLEMHREVRGRRDEDACAKGGAAFGSEVDDRTHRGLAEHLGATTRAPVPVEVVEQVPPRIGLDALQGVPGCCIERGARRRSELEQRGVLEQGWSAQPEGRGRGAHAPPSNVTASGLRSSQGRNGRRWLALWVANQAESSGV